jgi:manganese/iron transport system permease protein
MIVGAMLGAIASISGVYLSYYQNLPSGPAIVLVSSSLFLLALLFSPSQGILTHSIQTEPTNRFKFLRRND